MLTVGEVLRRSAEYLERHGIDTPRLDADLLLGHALGMDRMRHRLAIGGDHAVHHGIDGE